MRKIVFYMAILFCFEANTLTADQVTLSNFEKKIGTVSGYLRKMEMLFSLSSPLYLHPFKSLQKKGDWSIGQIAPMTSLAQSFMAGQISTFCKGRPEGSLSLFQLTMDIYLLQESYFYQLTKRDNEKIGPLLKIQTKASFEDQLKKMVVYQEVLRRNIDVEMAHQVLGASTVVSLLFTYLYSLSEELENIKDSCTSFKDQKSIYGDINAYISALGMNQDERAVIVKGRLGDLRKKMGEQLSDPSLRTLLFEYTAFMVFQSLLQQEQKVKAMGERLRKTGELIEELKKSLSVDKVDVPKIEFSDLVCFEKPLTIKSVCKAPFFTREIPSVKVRDDVKDIFSLLQLQQESLNLLSQGKWDESQDQALKMLEFLNGEQKIHKNLTSKSQEAEKKKQTLSSFYALMAQHDVNMMKPYPMFVGPSSTIVDIMPPQALPEKK